MTASHRVLLNFQYYRDAWTVHFIEADCKTTIGPRTRYYRFPTLEALRSFVGRCQPEDSHAGGVRSQRTGLARGE